MRSNTITFPGRIQVKTSPLCLFVWAESDGVSCSVKALQIVSVSARCCTDGPNKYQSRRKSDGTAAEGARRLPNEVSSELTNKHVEHRRMFMFSSWQSFQIWVFKGLLQEIEEVQPCIQWWVQPSDIFPRLNFSLELSLYYNLYWN